MSETASAHHSDPAATGTVPVRPRRCAPVLIARTVASGATANADATAANTTVQTRIDIR
jgi:hypothetical protein